MSDITLQNVLQFDAAPWSAGAEAWAKLAKNIEDASEDLTTGTRALPEVWPQGTASAAAQQKAVALRTQVSSTLAPAKRLANLFIEHAFAMKDLQALADGMVESARKSGWIVEASTGQITVPPAAQRGRDIIEVREKVQALLDQLTSVVERARARDAQTANAITDNILSIPGGMATARSNDVSRAIALAKKIQDPTQEPTLAELNELRKLVKTYGESKDKVFAHDFMTAIGPTGLLQLNGKLATLQLDYPGNEADNPQFKQNAALVKDLQEGLGTVLSTATGSTGTRGHQGYTPGKYELSNQWVDDLMTAGRSKMDIGSPYNTQRHLEDVYGYQLLAPMLHTVDNDGRLLSLVGGDMVDMEMSSHKNSALWTENRGENIRLDWTAGHDKNATPAGYDPMNALMDSLAKNSEGTKEMLTGVTTHAPGDPANGRLPRLDYLLTDRDWGGVKDTPVGPAWSAQQPQHPEDFKSPGLNNFGIALEKAATEQMDQKSRHLVESIVYETSRDESAQGYENLKPENKTEEFKSINLIHPEIRDSVGSIMAKNIIDVNAGINNPDPIPEGANFQVAGQDLTRLLADLGKDPDAHKAIAAAETLYATNAYQEFLSGERNPDSDFKERRSAMQTVTQEYGNVVGALDYGAGRASEQLQGSQDKTTNDAIEDRYKAYGAIADGLISVAADKKSLPFTGEIVKAFVEDVMDDTEERAKVNNDGKTSYEVGNSLFAGEESSGRLTEAALYNSGQLDVPTDIGLHKNGVLKRMSDWDENDYERWENYLKHEGADVRKDANDAKAAYADGVSRANRTIEGLK